MKMTQDLAELLEKLYNLKGENNIIIANINEEIKDVEDKIVSEAEKQSHNEVTKVETESQLSIFMTQKEAFCSTFTGIDNDTFNALKAIGVNLDISTMLETIDEKAPVYCDDLNHQIEDASLAIEEAKKAREELNDELNKLNEELDSAKDDREQLVNLLEQSLSPNVTERESLTTKYAKDVIGKFNLFSSAEVATLAKVILFPEDGLIEFDETYDERDHHVVDVPKVEEEVEEEPKEIEESNNEVTTQTYQDEDEEKTSNEDLTSQTYEDDEPTQIFDITNLNRHDDEEEEEKEPIEDIPQIEEPSLAAFNLQEEEPIVLTSEDKKEDKEENDEEEESEEEPVEEAEETQEVPEPVIENNEEEVKEEDPYQELKENLSNIGLNMELVEDKPELLEVLSNKDIKHIEENYETLRALNVNDETIYSEDANYLVDQDLNKKITLLRAKGISEAKIKELVENSDSGFREDYEVLEGRIKTIEDTTDKLSDENVQLLALDANKYNNNLNVLNDNGFEIDDKDLRNYQAVLYNSDNVKDDVEVLKNYLLSIQRKNGKYALGVFFKDAKELLFDIDDALEAKLEDLLEAHPEVLSNRVDTLIARSRYALSNNESIYEDEENGVFNKNIIDGLKFYRTYHQDVNEYMPREREEVNSSLEELINKETIKTLNEYYEQTTEFKDIELNDHEKELYNSLNALLEEKLNVVSSGTHTYLVNDVAISKNKVERNLAVLVKGRDSVTGNERELVLSAVLYNLRQSVDVLKEIIDSYDKDSTKDGGEA